MDAQNAADSDQTRPADASPKHQRSSETDGKAKPPSAATATSPLRDAKAKPVALAMDHPPVSTVRLDDAPEDRDSDAETIVLPGKDGHSPSKIRKVRQEDKSESDGDRSKGKGAANGHPNANHDGDRGAAPAPAIRLGEDASKKRLSVSAGSSADKNNRNRHKDAASSGLSSAPTSPPHHHRTSLLHRRRSDAANSAPSDSEVSAHRPASKTTLRDKSKSGHRLPSHKHRPPPKFASDDEGDFRKARPPRTTSVGLDRAKHKDFRTSHHKHHKRDASLSPPPRQHRRSTSYQHHSQLTSSNGLGNKKRRPPPPLHSASYQTDDSSNGDSPHPRTSKLRSLTTPASVETHASPAKMGPHKKHLDAHGQTLLARACARGEYEGAKQRLRERPEDLNVADYAGNTPLQIAAINGCEDIVKLLIDAGCNLDCVNYDKDTPLLDAVDNGHLGVVNLLLNAGVNPRKANVNGEEPIDRVTKDTDNADEIRAALLKAKKRAGERRRTSEDRHSHTDYLDARDSHAPESPRNSPATASGGTSRRTGTVRSTKTRNDLLYMPLDDKTLRQAAGRGDEETVARILQVKEGYDDPESMVAAARGGHDLVIQLLLGLGGANADPGPVNSLPSEFATPILAAIGQENIKVVELLLEQHGFDPTRRFKGETYYEIARRRQGTNWKEEEHLLKNAYDEYKRSHKDMPKTKSPGGRRERERMTRRDDAMEDVKPPIKQRHSSPSRESEHKKKSSKHDGSRDKRGSHSIHNTKGDEEFRRKVLASRPKKEASGISDRELSPSLAHKAPKARRTESDIAGMSSDGEVAKPRRKLVSKGELRGERDKQKRHALHREPPSSPRENRGADDLSEKARRLEKHLERAKALKRDETKDRRPSGDGMSRKHRTSLTPERPTDAGKKSHDVPVKRRRLDVDGHESRVRRIALDDNRQRKPASSRDDSVRPTNTLNQKERDENPIRDSEIKTVLPAPRGAKSIHVKDEDVDIPMPDLLPENSAETSLHEDRAKLEAVRARKLVAEQEALAKAKEEEEDRRRAEAERLMKKREKLEEARRVEESRMRVQEAEAKKRKEKEQELRDASQQEEIEKLAVEEEKKRKEEEELKRKEEEERKRIQEEKKRIEEENAKKKRQEEEEQMRREDEERKKREEQERQRIEQLQREAAEEAHRQREEEDRMERERRDRAHREELERKRAAREAELNRIRGEQERAQLDKLPPLLRWLVKYPSPKTTVVAEKFKTILGVRYDTIRPAFTGTPEGREQWVLNTHVALLLGEKDLDLSRYTAWERAPVSHLGKITLWRTEWPRYCLLSEKLWDLGRQLPGCYGDDIDPSECDFHTRQQLIRAGWERFEALEMFFVKLSDFLYTVPNIPHLRNIKLTVEYRELLESEAQVPGWQPTCKWKQDPGVDRFHGFAPRRKYFLHGAFVGEELPSTCQISSSPFPEPRVPRRGIIQVFPEDPDYVRICMEQGLEHLVKGVRTPSLTNGDVSSPNLPQNSTTPTTESVNGEHDGTNGAQANDISGFA
ncbi:hypothetical protein E4U09_003830 [Claviceps aff. purpurea]|uniref:Nasopharyngeal carcinoma susceptibility protein LZ16 n=1 Tax=Claviceps aff. purpurea TaxID=1967640 RepID=A0A9P7QFY2_9HYPO|nr:hypothetical protein E4U09_003830 [Claviceps aff. purpurea]